MPSVYLDNAASTRPTAEVGRRMATAAAECFGNPSAAHPAGAAASRLLEEARAELATALGAAAPEVTFTSGGTEANALGILGVVRRSRGRHLVASAIEHPSVLRNLEQLVAEAGFELTLVSPDARGLVAAADVAAAVRPDTALVAIMLVNNEVGTVQPVADIAQALRSRAGRRPHLHVDAVQAFGVLALRPAELGADSVALSAHKIHGPKGVGALWVRAGARLAPLWQGGGQERGLRPGSENLPGAVGFACAASLAQAARAAGASARMTDLRDRLEALIRAALPAARPTVAASSDRRAPHICSISLPGLPAEPLLHALGARGVTASAGSACASKLRGPSHVLKAIGVPDDETAVLRFSLSRETTLDDVEAAARALAQSAADVAPLAGGTAAGRGNRGVRRADQI